MLTDGQTDGHDEGRNIGVSFNVFHIYLYTLGKLLLVNVFTSAPFPWCGKHRHVTKVCQIYHSWDHGLKGRYFGEPDVHKAVLCVCMLEGTLAFKHVSFRSFLYPYRVDGVLFHLGYSKSRKERRKFGLMLRVSCFVSVLD